MTWTECPHCHKATFAYGDACDHCQELLSESGVLPLFGLGGAPLEHFICRECLYVNDYETKTCHKCGAALPKSLAEKIEDCKRAIQSNPLDHEVYRNLGNLYSQDAQDDNAIEAFVKATQINPNDGESFRGLAKIYYVFGYWRDAAKAYENAVRLKPDDVDSQFFLAASYKELGLAFDAIKVYHDLIKTKPEFAAAHFHLGIIYLKVGNLQEAREQYEILEQLDRHLSRKLKAEIKAAGVA